MKNLFRSLANSVSVLRQDPAFALGVVIIAVVSIAIASVVFRLLGLLTYAELPFKEPERLVSVTAVLGNGPDSTRGNVLVLANEWKSKLDGSFAILSRGQQRLRTNDEDMTVNVTSVAGPYFSILGATTKVGVSLDEFSSASAPERVVMLSYGLATRLYPGAPDRAVNDYVSMNGLHYRVVGVLDPDFQSPEDLKGQSVAAWVPLSAEERQSTTWGWFSSNLQVVGKLHTGDTVTGFARRVASLTAEIVKANAANIDSRTPTIRGEAIALRDDVVGDSNRLSFLMAAIVVLIALFSLSMIISFWSGRLADRQRELATYAALGATRRALWNLLAVEATILCILAVIGALIFGKIIATLVSRAVDGYLPRAHEISSSLPFIITGIGFVWLLFLTLGWATVSSMKGRRLAEALASGTKGATGSQQTAGRFASAIYTAQLCAVLFAMAISGAFLAESVEKLTTPLGYNQDSGVYLDIDLPEPLRVGAMAQDFSAKLTSALSSTAGFRAASMVRMPIATTALALYPVRTSEGTEPINLAINEVQQGFFHGIGLSLLSGRTISDVDEIEHRKVIVLGKTAATRIGKEQSAIGEHLLIDGDQYEIIGIVNDISSPAQSHPAARLQAYRPYRFVDGPGSIGIIVFGKQGSDIDTGKARAFIRASNGAFLSSASTLREMNSAIVKIFYLKATLAASTIAIVIVLGLFASYLSAKQSVRRESYQTSVLYSLGASFRKLKSSILERSRISMLIAVILFIAGVGGISSASNAMKLFSKSDILSSSLVSAILLTALSEVINGLLAKRLIQAQGKRGEQ